MLYLAQTADAEQVFCVDIAPLGECIMSEIVLLSEYAIDHTSGALRLVQKPKWRRLSLVGCRLVWQDKSELMDPSVEPAHCIRNIRGFLLVRHVFAEVRPSKRVRDHVKFVITHPDGREWHVRTQ